MKDSWKVGFGQSIISIEADSFLGDFAVDFFSSLSSLASLASCKTMKTLQVCIDLLRKRSNDLQRIIGPLSKPLLFLGLRGSPALKPKPKYRKKKSMVSPTVPQRRLFAHSSWAFELLRMHQKGKNVQQAVAARAPPAALLQILLNSPMKFCVITGRTFCGYDKMNSSITRLVAASKR